MSRYDYSFMTIWELQQEKAAIEAELLKRDPGIYKYNLSAEDMKDEETMRAAMQREIDKQKP